MFLLIESCYDIDVVLWLSLMPCEDRNSLNLFVLLVCPFDYTAFADSGKVVIP